MWFLFTKLYELQKRSNKMKTIKWNQLLICVCAVVLHVNVVCFDWWKSTNLDFFHLNTFFDRLHSQLIDVFICTTSFKRQVHHTHTYVLFDEFIWLSSGAFKIHKPGILGGWNRRDLSRGSCLWVYSYIYILTDV